MKKSLLLVELGLDRNEEFYEQLDLLAKDNPSVLFVLGASPIGRYDAIIAVRVWNELDLRSITGKIYGLPGVKHIDLAALTEVRQYATMRGFWAKDPARIATTE